MATKMEALGLTPQMILGFSGESSSSCEGREAKEYMEKIRSLKIKEVQAPSADRLKELSIQIDSLKTQ